MPKIKPRVSAKHPKESKSLKPFELSVIAIGASAGGLEALQEFLSYLPEIKNVAIIVAQHLSPTHKSMLVQLLSRETKLEVAEAENGVTLEANKIYITPPDKEISISAGKIVLKKPQSSVGPKPSVDVLFQSLAEDAAHRVLGIILSGTGSDGASGVRMLKKNGGFIIAQEPHTAKYDGMPLAAIETGEVDLVLPPEKMGEEILEHFLNPGHIRIKQAEADDSGSSLEKIIKILSKRTGTDFSNYKSATIIRRLEKRLAILKIKSIDAYLKLLEENPKEQDEMFNMILIGVTTFFRDMEAFGSLENTLHQIINAKTNKDPIRIWVPGCYTGEEAYSIAILFNRILKDRTQNYNIQIFATDIDEKAIATARKGIYSPNSLENVPKEIIENYFIQDGNEYELVKSVRSMVLFSRHDLTNNPPFLKLDLISCRNLLIYFGASLQQQIIPIFHYALLQDGYLFLGKSETVGQYSDLFATIDGKNKIFQRKRGGNLHSIKFSAFKAQKQTLPQHAVKKVKKDLSISDLVKETLFNTYEHPYVVINEEFDILEINGEVRLFMSLPQGTIQVNLLKMVNPELQIEIRSVITKAIKARESVRSSIKKFELFGNFYYVRITAKPLIFTETAEELFIVIFERLDLEEFVSKGIVTNDRELVDVRLRELEHELAATKEHLQTYIEELETSNEEMQSLNEEMQSTNEELQSSNEELETSNEELQSTNEEIQITYSELKAANLELERKEIALKENEANINALLNNKLQAFVLIDSTYKVIKYNEKAEDLFLELRNKNLKRNDSFIDLVEPGQLELFVRDFSNVLKGESITREMKLTGYKGSDHWYSLNYTPVSTVDRNINGISIGILDITDLKIALTNLNEKEKMLSSVYNATSIGLCVTDDTGVFIEVNEAYCGILGYQRDELIGKNVTMMAAVPNRKAAQQLHDQFIETGKEVPGEGEAIKKDGSTIHIYTTAELLELPNGKRFKITSVRDITERLKAEQVIIESEKKYKNLFENNPAPMFIWDFSNKQIIDCNLEALIQYGYSREEFLQLSIKDIRLKEDIADLEKATASEEAYGNIHTKIWRHQRKNGELFFVEVNGHLINYNGVKASLVMVTDITEKLKAEEELKQSEAFLAEAQRLAKLGSWNFDFRNDKLTWSDVLYEVFGTDKETFKETHGTFINLIDEEDRAFVQETSKRAQEKGEPFNIEYRITTPAGVKRIIEEFGNVEKDEQGKIVRLYGTAQDITERKTAEEKIRESNQRFENVTKATYDAIWDWDMINNKLYWGDMYTKLFGEMRDNHLSDLEKVRARLHPDEIIPILTSGKAAIKGKELNWTYEHRYLKADGSYAFVSNKALIIRDQKQRAIRITGAMQDITKQKQEDQRLKLMSSVVTNTNDSVIITEAEPFDEPGPRIIYVNDAFSKMTGYAPEEVIGKTPRILQGPKSDKAELKRLGIALRNWESCEATTINYKKNGEEFWINFSVSPVADERGWFTHLISVARDITERKNAEIQKNLFNKITQVFNESGNMVATLKKVLQQITSFGGFSFAEAWLVTADGKAINKMTSHAETDAMQLFLSESADIKSLNKGEGMVGTAWESKKIQNWHDVDKRKEFIRREAAKKAGLKTALALPLFHNYEVNGVLIIGLEQDESTLSGFQVLMSELGNYIGSEIKRKQLELELHQLFSFAPDIIAILGMDGYFKKVNPATLELLEYNETELLSNPFVNFIHPDDKHKTTDEVKSLIEGNPTLYFENRYITKSGKIKWLAWTATPSPQEAIIFAVAKDITEKRELEDLLQKATQMARIGGWEVDLLKGTLFWSAITKEIHEVSVDFVPEMDTAINFYKAGANREKITILLQEAMENGQAWDEEFTIITGKQNERWVRVIGDVEMVNGKCIRIFGSFQDIDERKKSAMAITQTLEEKNDILESIGDAFFAVNTNWIVTYWNHVAEKVLGMSRENIVGKYLWDLYEDAVDTDFYKFYHLAVKENKVQHFEANYQTLNVWVEVSAYPSTNGLSVYFKDITQRKASELKLKELNENLQKKAQELETSNRELEQFAYVASHDLQEPLRMVTGFLTQLDKKYDNVLDDRAKKYIGFAVDGASRMRSIILDLLEFSKIGRTDGNIEQVDLNELITEIKVLYNKQIVETKATISSNKLPTLQLYKTPLRQVFQNLISNALKYCKTEKPPLIKISAADMKTYWLFSISDNGIGIDAEYFDKIFILFQRLHNKDEYSGTGMGLAVTKKVIESWNGKIWVESTEGKGSTFYFTIPVQNS